MLDLVDLEGRREPGKVPTRQGGFDLIWDAGCPAAAGADRPTSLPSLLGCHNPHDQTQQRQPLAQVQEGDAAAAAASAAAAARRQRLAGARGSSNTRGGLSGSASTGGSASSLQERATAPPLQLAVAAGP
jgi:hypothetical protein